MQIYVLLPVFWHDTASKSFERMAFLSKSDANGSPSAPRAVLHFLIPPVFRIFAKQIIRRAIILIKIKVPPYVIRSFPAIATQSAQSKTAGPAKADNSCRCAACRLALRAPILLARPCERFRRSGALSEKKKFEIFVKCKHFFNQTVILSLRAMSNIKER